MCLFSLSKKASMCGVYQRMTQRKVPAFLIFSAFLNLCSKRSALNKQKNSCSEVCTFCHQAGFFQRISNKLLTFQKDVLLVFGLKKHHNSFPTKLFDRTLFHRRTGNLSRSKVEADDTLEWCMGIGPQPVQVLVTESS